MSGDTGNQVTIWSIVSLLAGTVISAIVSYILQRNSFAEARKEKALDRFEARKSLGLTLFHKMIRIASTLGQLKASMLEAYDKIEAENMGDNPWQGVLPLANFPDRVKFTPEEMTLLMLMDRELFNEMGPFDDIHNSLLEMFQLYRDKRTALTDTLSAEMKGNLGTTAHTKDEMMKMAPKAAELNVLLEGMLQRSQLDSDQAWELLDDLKDSLNEQFKLGLKLERKPSDLTNN